MLGKKNKRKENTKRTTIRLNNLESSINDKYLFTISRYDEKKNKLLETINIKDRNELNDLKDLIQKTERDMLELEELFLDQMRWY